VNYETLGFRLDSKEVIEHIRKGKLPPQKISNIKNYSLALMGYMLEMANLAHLDESDWNRTIFIETKGVKTTDFKGVREKIPELIESGKKAVENYFEEKGKDPFWSTVPS
jgi:NTE family protein